MSEPLVLIEQREHGITVLTLNRPERRNALGIVVMEALCAAMDAANLDESQRVIILRGAGPVFCAGLDLKETKPGVAGTKVPSGVGKASDRASGLGSRVSGLEESAAERDRSLQVAELAHQSAELVARTLEAVSCARPVTIAAVHGAALAGGAGLMSACDLVVASEETKIGYPEVRRGLVAGLVMTFMRRQMHERHVRELLVLAEPIDAARARDMGLVNRVVPTGAAFDEALKLAHLVLKGAPGALAHSRAMLRELWPRTIQQDLAWALEHHKTARASAESLEGIAAFNEKRLPKWDPEAEKRGPGD
jgi:methylglutaconyl-CoA hydratase